jgi:hypothetical protein
MRRITHPVTPRNTILTAVVAVILLVFLIVLLVIFHADTWLLVATACAAGVLVIAKEALTAFARGQFSKSAVQELEDLAAVSGLFAAVLGVPAVVGTILSLAVNSH